MKEKTALAYCMGWEFVCPECNCWNEIEQLVGEQKEECINCGEEIIIIET